MARHRSPGRPGRRACRADGDDPPHADDEDFVAFVVDASPRLPRSACLICGDPMQAEELVQAALEKVYVKWRSVRRTDAFAYTRKILLNQHIDTRRRRSRERLVGEPLDVRHIDGEPEDTNSRRPRRRRSPACPGVALDAHDLRGRNRRPLMTGLDPPSTSARGGVVAAAFRRSRR